MTKKRVAMTLSLPYDMAQEYVSLAREESRNKSELFREMFKAYKKEKIKEELHSLREYGAERSKASKVFTEEDVERIVAEGRRRRVKGGF